jgi:hypothetical protein
MPRSSNTGPALEAHGYRWDRDFVVRAVGPENTYILDWLRGDPPTEEQLTAWEAAYAADEYRRQRRKAIERAIPPNEREEAIREGLAAVFEALRIAPPERFAALQTVVAAAKLAHPKEDAQSQ